MITAEVSRHQCSKLGELAVEGNSGPLHQTIGSAVLPSSAVFGLPPRAYALQREAAVADMVFRELCLRRGT